MREVVDAVLDVVGDVADLLHPVLGLVVVAAGAGEVAEERLHAGELVVDELDVAADAADQGVLLREEAAELVQEGFEGRRRRPDGELHGCSCLPASGSGPPAMAARGAREGHQLAVVGTGRMASSGAVGDVWMAVRGGCGTA